MRTGAGNSPLAIQAYIVERGTEVRFTTSFQLSNCSLADALSIMEGEGLKIDLTETELTRLETAATKEKFSISAEPVQRIRQDLPAETALIGFCGAPWTVATVGTRVPMLCCFSCKP